MVQKHSKTAATRLDWDGLRAILLVARHGTVRAASAEIGVAHTTLAHRIAVAEDAMGVVAFVKSVKGYRLTEEGRRIVDHAERMASETEALALYLEGAVGTLSGTVSVSMNASLMIHVAARGVAILQARHPGIQLHFKLGDSLVDLDRGESDIVLRLQRQPHPDLFGRKLCDARSAVYATKKASAALRELPDPLPVIGWAADDFVAGTFASLGFKRIRIVATVADIDAQLALARAGEVAVELPCYVGDAQPDLTRFPGTRLRDLNALWILTHESLRKSPRIRAAFEALAAAALDHKPQIEGMPPR